MARQIESTSDAGQLLTAIRKLAAVADPVAVDYLGRAVKASNLVGDIAIPALERIGNDAARAVLVDVMYGRDVDHAATARRALTRLDQRGVLKR